MDRSLVRGGDVLLALILGPCGCSHVYLHAKKAIAAVAQREVYDGDSLPRYAADNARSHRLSGKPRGRPARRATASCLGPPIMHGIEVVSRAQHVHKAGAGPPPQTPRADLSRERWGKSKCIAFAAISRSRNLSSLKNIKLSSAI